MTMRRLCVGVLLGTSLALGQGTLAGKFVSASGGAVAGGTLLLQLSQAANLPGSWAVAPTAADCATTKDGGVVGAPDPVIAPVVNAFTVSGTLPAGTYYVVLAYTGAGLTTTLASPEATTVLSSAGEIQVVAPALSPPEASGYAVFIGTTPGGETEQGTATLGANYAQTTPLASGAAMPGQNLTSCTLLFNDSLIPTYTYYTATLSDRFGNVLPGFPQNWYLAGVEVDVSRLIPLASSPAVRFPMPIIANPPVLGTVQSVESGLNMNGNLITESGNLGPGMLSLYWPGGLPAANTTLAMWTPNSAVQVQRIDVNAQTAGSGGTLGTSIQVSDGTTTCTFNGLLVGANTNSSKSVLAQQCGFSAGVPLTVKLASDDHGLAPQNLNIAIEMTSR